jgi:PAS domain S-box-containing protein
MGIARRSRRHDLPMSALFFDPDQIEPDEDLPRLIAKLAEASALLEEARNGRMDTLGDPVAFSYLLHEAKTALVESDERAKEEAALLEAVVRSAPDIIVYVAADGTVRWSNQPLPGHPVEAIVGAHWVSLAAPTQRDDLERVFAEVLATGEPGSFDGPGPTSEGREGWRSRRFGPVRRDGTVVGVVIVSRDLTDAKNAELQLVIADRMASIGTLAAGMAHEINNPLATVIGNLDVALESLKSEGAKTLPSEEMLEIVEDAIDAADRIRFVVRDLKLFSRIADEGDHAIDIERVIHTSLRMARNETRHRATIETCYGHVNPVVANESRLGQVFLNLIVNAAQALPDGDAEANRIRISTFETPDGRAVVKISDTGPGIPEEVQKHLFTPFFTTKPVGIGTGLGLSICRRIVTALGGELTFHSEPGRGTDFFVSLPIAGAEEAGEPRPPRVEAATRRGRVLVVDDEILVCDTAAHMLGGEHDVVGVTGGEAALSLLRAGQRFDVILCDLMMPQMTGIDFFAALRSFDPAVQPSVVFMTGGAFTPRARTFLSTVRNPSLEKPFDMHGLRKLVNDMCR